MEPLNFIQLKIPLILFAVAVSIFIIIQIYVIVSTSRIQSQEYKLIESCKDFEIRFYPAVTLATVSSNAKSYRQLGNSGYTKLARYIFGGNTGKRKIGMITPVHMEINDVSSSVSFVMPLQYNNINFPQPYDSSVSIQIVEDEYVAAIQFGGFASDKVIHFYTQKLQDALKESKVPYYGYFRFLGYNPPYQLVSRKNEIIVSVTWDEPNRKF